MKKQDLFKFSLTAICVAVLSACGSSGGGSLAVDNANTTTPSTNNNNAAAEKAAAEKAAAAEAAAKQAAAEKAAAEKAAAEAAAKQAAAEKAAAAAKTAADKAAAEKAAAEAKAAAEKAAAEKAAKEAAAKAAADQAAAVKKAAEEAAKKAADEAAKKAAIEQAAAVKKAAEEAAAKALKDKEAADKKAAEDQAKAAEEAAKKAAEEAAKKAADEATNPFGAKDKLTAEPDTARETSFVGFKQTVKVNSNLATNTSTETDSTSDVPTPMALQQPHASLDNIVVAEPKGDAGAARVYLEDFDTRFIDDVALLTETNKYAEDSKLKGIRGNRTLKNIYLNEYGVTADKVGNPEIEQQRETLAKAVEAAKKAVLAEKQKAVNIDNKQYPDDHADLKVPEKAKMDIIKDEDRAIENMTIAGATAEELSAMQKARWDALYAQKSQLQGELATIAQKVDGLQANLTQAEAALAVFNTKNPKPEELADNEKNSTERSEALGKGYDTKTDKIGQKAGAIWVFAHEDVANKHQNFTEQSKDADKNKRTVKKGFVYDGKDMNGNIIAKAYNIENLNYTAGAINSQPTGNGRELQARSLDETVAEVYGYRSKAYNKGQGFTTPLDTSDLSAEKINDNNYVTANNLPLVNEYHGAKLENVQYGRVTTKLDGVEASEQYLKEGLQLNQHGTTYVASFGEYGKDGTENHYFFRGINNVGGTELTQLKKDEKNGIITYNGHAVTYGLDNNFRGNIPIPTAFGARTGFVSGNHVSAAVNLANGEVTGNIYNKWFDSYNSPKDLVQVNLVSFKGTLADNGNIAGTSTRIDNGTSGLFGATLYGKGAEMGGIIASEATGKDKWGGSFGAIRVPATPEEKAKAGMAVGADQKN